MRGDARSATANVSLGMRHAFAEDHADVVLTVAAAQQDLGQEGDLMETPDFDEPAKDRIVRSRTQSGMPRRIENQERACRTGRHNTCDIRSSPALKETIRLLRKLSNGGGMRPKKRHCLREADAFERSQIFIRRTRRTAQRRSVAADSREHTFGTGIEQAGDKGVGMLRGEAVGRQPVGRKVPQIPRHDNIRLSPDSRRQHMAITGIRKFERRDQGFVTRHDRFGKVPVHHCAGPFQHARIDVRPINEKVPHPFRMDVGTR